MNIIIPVIHSKSMSAVFKKNRNLVNPIRGFINFSTSIKNEGVLNARYAITFKRKTLYRFCIHLNGKNFQ